MIAIAPLLLVAMMSAGDSTVVNPLYEEAVADLQSGRNDAAEKKVNLLLQSDSSSPLYRKLLGEVYVRTGRLKDALRAFEASSSAAGHTDAQTIKRLAEVDTWTRGFTDARTRLSGVVSSAPDDREASDALTDLRLKRSFQVYGSAGGNEVDYVNSAAEVGAFGGWIDWLDLYGGYSNVDKPFYRRKTTWMDAYMFPDYRIAVRAGYRNNIYEYPVSATAAPDLNAYRDVPEYQIEGSYTDGDHNTVSLELEYFRPGFFWNDLLHANNFKATATVGHTILGPVYARIFVAVLRDPDPESFGVEPATNRVLAFGYETLSLTGGAIGLDQGPFSGEVQYVPDRDLDRSISWSIFGRMRYDLGVVRLQYDVVYDRYAESAGRGYSASRVNMLTVLFAPFPSFEIRPGVKILSKESTEAAPFLSVRIRTGL